MSHQYIFYLVHLPTHQYGFQHANDLSATRKQHSQGMVLSSSDSAMLPPKKPPDTCRRPSER